MSSADSNKLAVTNITLAALAVLMLFASLNPEWNLWGLDFIAVLPL